MSCEQMRGKALFLELLKDEHLTLINDASDLSSLSILVSREILEFLVDIFLIKEKHSLVKRIV